jgi:Phosphotransferase enzyme family
MTHGDLIPGNVLVSNGRLSGIIDVGGLGPADPALGPHSPEPRYIKEILAVLEAGLHPRSMGAQVSTPTWPGEPATTGVD